MMSASELGVGIDLERARTLVAARDEPGRVEGLGRPMVLLASTTSTNDEARRGAREGAPHGATWVTEAQTAGRGRQGRAWWAPAGDGLLFSVLVQHAPPSARLPQIALLAGLAVHDAVTRAAPLAGARVKWPNDVVVGSRKVAGVLVEAITSGSRVDAVVIGIGINVHTREFPAEIADRATSVALALGVATGASPPDRAQILVDTLGALARDLPLVTARGLAPLRARLEAADALRGHRVQTLSGTVDGGADGGVAEGFDEDGRLLVRRDDGVLAHWAAGEVHLIKPSSTGSPLRVR
jgi:BirA family biotin operon repressor/biotin-[acetyl-CoA-carboxylase] ligase